MQSTFCFLAILCWRDKGGQVRENEPMVKMQIESKLHERQEKVRTHLKEPQPFYGRFHTLATSFINS